MRDGELIIFTQKDMVAFVMKLLKEEYQNILVEVIKLKVEHT